jgi:hypothetical protein
MSTVESHSVLCQVTNRMSCSAEGIVCGTEQTCRWQSEVELLGAGYKQTVYDSIMGSLETWLAGAQECQNTTNRPRLNSDVLDGRCNLSSLHEYLSPIVFRGIALLRHALGKIKK